MFNTTKQTLKTNCKKRLSYFVLTLFSQLSPHNIGECIGEEEFSTPSVDGSNLMGPKRRSPQKNDWEDKSPEGELFTKQVGLDFLNKINLLLRDAYPKKGYSKQQQKK